MLVLTRKESEAIYIGDNIVVTVIRIQGNRVRFGIEAPKEIRIVRSELLQEPVDEVAKTLDIPPLLDPGSGDFGYGDAIAQ